MPLKSKSNFDEGQFIHFSCKVCAFVVTSEKSLPKPRLQKFSPSSSFIVFSFIFTSVNYFELIFAWYEVSLFYVLCVCFVKWLFIPEPFVEKTIPCSIELLWHLFKMNHKYEFTSRLCSVSLIYIPVLKPLCHCLDYCSFIASVEVRWYKSSNFALSRLLWIVWTLYISADFQDQLLICTRKPQQPCFDFV